MIFTILLSIVLLVVSLALFVSLKKNIELIDRIEEIEDSVEVAIKILEEQYVKMDEKSKIEVFSDEPIVRSLVEDIAIAKESVLKVSKFLDMMVEDNEIEKEKEDEIEKESYESEGR